MYMYLCVQIQTCLQVFVPPGGLALHPTQHNNLQTSLVCFSEREKDRWWQSFNRPMKTNPEMLILTKIKTRHVKMYNANIYSVQWAAYSTYFSLTHIHMDLNMHEQCGRHLNTVPEALVVTLNVLDASAEFSPSRPALQSLSPLLHPASLVPLPGEPLNPGEEHIVSTCLSAHAR